MSGPHINVRNGPTAPERRPSEPLTTSCLVVIPAFNEEATIGAVIEGVKAHLPDVDVVVVDDASADSTRTRAEIAGAKVLRHAANLGYGGAVQTGLRYARGNGYDVAAILDADGQHDPADLPRLLEPLARNEADLVVGSRYVTKGSRGWFSMRRLGNGLMSQMVYLLTRMQVRDVTSGFQVMNLKTLDFLADEYPVDFPDADIILLLLVHRFRIQEVPVMIRPRSAGVSMHGIGSAFVYPFKILLSMIAILLRTGIKGKGAV